MACLACPADLTLAGDGTAIGKFRPTADLSFAR